VNNTPIGAVAAPEFDAIQREIIDFDSEASAGRDFLALISTTGLSQFEEISWPARLAPVTGAAPTQRSAAQPPKADVLIVTWTVDEGHALSRVLTPGKDSRDDWRRYTHNYQRFARRMRPGAPALVAQALGAWWPATIAGKRVVLFKSDSHLSQDGPEVPNIDIWRQIIDEVRPELVITTGTAGGIGKELEVGDVIVSPVVSFDCQGRFKGNSCAQACYSSEAPVTTGLAKPKELMRVNAKRLPNENRREPKIVAVPPTAVKGGVVTTDFFGFDTSDDHFKLQGRGAVSEMGEAVLGMVCSEMGNGAPRWLAVRNVSDPQIDAKGRTLSEEAQVAAGIYKGYGRWSSVCSAIVCWGVVGDAAERHTLSGRRAMQSSSDHLAID
jgi:hypothetical protein